MIRTLPPVACFLAAALAWSSASLAVEEPKQPLPPFDWSDFVDDMEEGDHVVGEELCATPR